MKEIGRKRMQFINRDYKEIEKKLNKKLKRRDYAISNSI